MGTVLSYYAARNVVVPTFKNPASREELAWMANVFHYAAEDVCANRKQSVRSAIWSAARRLLTEYAEPYEQVLHRCHAMMLTLYGAEVHTSFIYNGGYGKGFWLSQGQKDHMALVLLFAYQYVVFEMLGDGAERQET